MTDLEKIERKVLRGGTVEGAVKKFNWREFEKIIGDIFTRNDFRVRRNFRFRTKRRWENDLIAARNGVVFCVDCKRWSEGREKKWGILKAAREQRKRTQELEKFVRSNPIARGTLSISDARFVPMIVTLHQERALKEGGTYVVPVGKLNSFVLGFELII